MPIGSESDRDVIRPKYQMVVPGLGVFIAPKAVARLFQLHDYTRCPNFRKKYAPMERTLYPILRPNVYYSPRMFHLHQARRFKNEKRKEGTIIKYELQPVTFYISSGIGDKWWKQEAKDAYLIVSDALPEWIELVIHRGLTPEKAPGNYWSLSDTQMGARLMGDALLPVYDIDALIKIAIAYVRKWTYKEYQQTIKDFSDRLKNLKYIGEKQLSSAEKNSRIVFSLN